MATPRPPARAQVVQFVFDNSLLLIVGALSGLLWANIDAASYRSFAYALHFLVNDVGMVFFFALATKEVYEAMLPGGPLASPRQAAVPVLAAVGGMAVPASLYAVGTVALGAPELLRGWAIPCATDIAFAYLVARMVFPDGHPAIPFLLLLAIADDALGLILLAVFYPSAPLATAALTGWLAPALLVAWIMRRLGVRSFWLYVIGPGLMSWMGLYQGGIHPALAMVPIVPFMPHEKSLIELFGGRGPMRARTMHEFEHWWKAPVQIVLFAFGLVNAGVPFASVGPVTAVIAASLIAGKPIGIVGFTLAAGLAGFARDARLDLRALVVLGVTAGIGFTVALFFTTAAFPAGETLDQAKMGALLSFAAAPVAVGLGRVWRLRSAVSPARR